MDAIETLCAEHRRIESVLDVLDVLGENGATRASLSEVVAVLRGYADAYHHAKEEDVLFRAMVEAGVSEDDGPIAMMLAQHEEARRLVSELGEIAEAGPDALSVTEQLRLSRIARDYSVLLRTHIREEDDVVYPLARASIRPAAWDDVIAECAEIDATRALEVAALVARAAACVARHRAT